MTDDDDPGALRRELANAVETNGQLMEELHALRDRIRGYQLELVAKGDMLLARDLELSKLRDFADEVRGWAAERGDYPLEVRARSMLTDEPSVAVWVNPAKRLFKSDRVAPP